MNQIEVLEETANTVTVRMERGRYEAMLDAMEDAADLAAVDAHRAYEARVGWEAAKANYLTGEEVLRLLDGETPVQVWRAKRGMTQRVLAAAADVSVSYLSEIEGGQKPGSVAALKRLAAALGVAVEALIP